MSHSRGPAVVIGGVLTLVTALVISGVAFFTMRDTNRQVDDAVSAVIDSLSDPTRPAPVVVAPAGAPAVAAPADAERETETETADAEPVAPASADMNEVEPVEDAPVDVTPVVVPSDLLRGGVADVVEEIRVARGADTLRVLEISIYEGYAAAQVQNPSALDEVDEYRWNGAVGSPAPVRLFGDGDLEPNLFDHDEVVWTAIPALVEAAPGLVDIADGVVTHAIVRRDLPFSDQVRTRVFVSGARANGFVDADTAGNVVAIFAG